MSNLITPLNTAWMVSTTVRELKLEVISKTELKVYFLGFFGNFVSNDLDYQDIVLLFSGVKKFDYFPDYTQEATNRIDNYKWERIPEFRNESGSLADHKDKFNNIWKESGICPNPSVYQVEDSDWAQSASPSNKNLNHYLILGGDYNLEVLATSYSFSQ